MKKSLIISIFVILIGSEISLRAMEESQREEGNEPPLKRMRRHDDPYKNFKRTVLPGLGLSGEVETDDEDDLARVHSRRNVIDLGRKVAKFNKQFKEDYLAGRSNS